MGRTIKLATRGSALALAQATMIQGMLKDKGVDAEILTVQTKGDLDRTHALKEIGGNGLFMREVENALMDGRADIAVHCGKDLPYELAEGLVIAGVPAAADPRDVLVTREGTVLAEGSVIGTGSARRIAEYTKLVPGACFKGIRGNITTRIRKLREGEYDAIVLAKAGIDRLAPDMSGLTVRVFEPDEMVPACTQGILAIECREDDAEVIEILKGLTDEHARMRFDAEREVFNHLHADCSMAVGIYSEVVGSQLSISALYQDRRYSVQGNYSELKELAEQISDKLLMGQVILVGAGCGRDLITVAGLNALKEADAVVYDDLIDQALLMEVREDAKLVYVGKRSGCHSKKQEETSQILVDLAREGHHVVRLKGGDSFVFGRGGEEYLALEAAGVPCRLIPGVTSSVAVPENAGIPVTHRQAARSFTVVTGHTADGTGENYEALAQLTGTIVFLMGKQAYPQITQKLIDAGKDPQTPAAVISRGFSPKQQRMDGVLADIAVRSIDMPTPAILVVGKTAGYHMVNTIDAPLNGAGVTVTGSKTFAHKLEKLLKSKGAYVTVMPTLEICEHEGEIPESFEEYSWLGFTSSNGVDIFFNKLAQRHTDLRALAALKFACIGAGTAERLMSHGIKADFVPTKYTAQCLGEELPAVLTESDKLLLLRAQEGSVILSEKLTEAGVKFEDRAIYHAEYIGEEAAEGRGDLGASGDESDYVVFGSAGGVKSYFRNNTLAEKTVPVCIGELTAAELKKHTEQEFLVAAKYTAEEIEKTIEKHWVR